METIQTRNCICSYEILFINMSSKYSLFFALCFQNLAHESGVLEQGLRYLNEKLETLSSLHDHLPSGGSMLFKELSAASNIEEAVNSPTITPLLHNLSAVHAYIMMLVHVCRTGQADIRQVSSFILYNIFSFKFLSFV